MSGAWRHDLIPILSLTGVGYNYQCPEVLPRKDSWHGFSSAARATPKGCEGLGYSLMLSIRNVAASGADVVGSYLADHNWPFAHLVYLSAGTTAIVLILLPLLPAALMRSKDTAG